MVRAKASETAAFAIVVVEVAIAILLSFWISKLISNPINSLVGAARSSQQAIWMRE